MERCNHLVALGAAKMAGLIALLLLNLREDQQRLQNELDELLAQGLPDRASLRQLIEDSHDLGELADHFLLAIARNEAAKSLWQDANELFDGFRGIEASATVALARQGWC